MIRPVAEDARVATRRIQALELRKHGASYREIAEALHVSLGTAYRDIQIELAAAVKLKNKRADELVELEVQRLDQWLLALDKGINAGQTKAIAQAIKIGARRARLLGLDAPTKIAPTDPTGAQAYSDLSESELKKRVEALLKVEKKSRGKSK